MAVRGVAKVKILGGCRDLVLPTDLVMVTIQWLGEGSKGRGFPLPFGFSYDIHNSSHLRCNLVLHLSSFKSNQGLNDGDQEAKVFFSVWPNLVIFNGKGRHACKYVATKYESLLFIGVGGGVGAQGLQPNISVKIRAICRTFLGLYWKKNKLHLSSVVENQKPTPASSIQCLG